MQTIEVNKGQDFAVEYRIRAGDGHGKPVRLRIQGDADIGATTINIHPDHPDLADNAVLLYGEDALVTVNGACVAGDPTLTVDATTFPVRAGDDLDLLVDLTGYTIKAVVLANRGDAAASAVIADSAFTVTVPTQTGESYGKVNIACLAAVTDGATPAAGEYYGALWRRDSGNTRPLDEFTFKLNASAEAGFA